MAGGQCAKVGIRCVGILVLIALVSPQRVVFSADAIAERLNRAETLAQQGDLAAAEREFRELLQLDPNSYVAHNDLGGLYMRQKRY